MGVMMSEHTKTTRVEEVLVGIFGAFVGGEFLADVVRGAALPASQSFTVKLALAAASACVMLTVLALLRRAVGPMKAGKSRSHNRN